MTHLILEAALINPQSDLISFNLDFIFSLRNFEFVLNFLIESNLSLIYGFDNQFLGIDSCH